jgi:hypothetical protein
MPLLAERAGMSSMDTGWKPWLVLYRIAFVMAIPAAGLQILGKGTEIQFGESAGPAAQLSLANLQNNYWNYYELVDGFVALNMTKGVTETLVSGEHGVQDHRRVSRFRDAELQVNFEPYTDEVEPTETPGRLVTYRIAPVFLNWASCLTRYRMSTSCLQENPVKAWAISKSNTFCSMQRSVGCKPPKPLLGPVYRCSKPRNGTTATGDEIVYGEVGVNRTTPIEGLCGHVTKTPPEGAIDELGALLLYDAWPKASIPNENTLWLDVTPDDCLNDIEACQANWSNLYLAGLAFQVLTNLLILIPCIQDCRVDARIRLALKFVEEEKLKKKNAAQKL